MIEPTRDLDGRVAQLEEEMDALERKVEALREEIRSLARLLELGDLAVRVESAR